MRTSDNAMERKSVKALKFKRICKRIASLKDKDCQIQKMGIHIQLIETVVERLPSLMMMTSILFLSFEIPRLGHLIGKPLQNGYYAFLVFTSLACNLWGMILSLINLRFIHIIYTPV